MNCFSVDPMGISEKLKGLKFMQRAQAVESEEIEESFATYFCKSGVFNFSSKQKMRDRGQDAQKKLRN